MDNQLSVLFPLVEVDDFLVAVLVGQPTCEFGDAVTLVAGKQSVGRRYILGVDCLPANELDEEFLALFKFRTPDEFVEALSRTYGTAFGPTVLVTIYTLYDRPVEEYVDLAVEEPQEGEEEE